MFLYDTQRADFTHLFNFSVLNFHAEFCIFHKTGETTMRYLLTLFVFCISLAAENNRISLETALEVATARLSAFRNSPADLTDYAILYDFSNKPVACLVFSQDAYTVVSLRLDRIPIPEFGSGRPYFIEKSWLYQHIAEKSLGRGALLSKIFYISPMEVYLLFTKGEDKLLIDAMSLRQCKPEELHRVSRGTKRKSDPFSREAWRRILSGLRERKSAESIFHPLLENRVEGVPFYIWSYGCSPTASAMILGYWDKNGYGRFVDYYFDHWDVVIASYIDTGWIYNVPNVQRELAIAMETDTTTGGTYFSTIAPGQEAAAEQNDYSFTSDEYWGDEYNEWAFDVIKNEIDAGRPFHWAVADYYYIGPHHGFIDTLILYHSVTGVGYVEGPGYAEDYVIVHDTWSSVERYWSLYTYYDGEYSYAEVCTFVPECLPSGYIEITEPIGGSVFYCEDTVTLKWNTDITEIAHLTASMSLDNCGNWIEIAAQIPVAQGTLSVVLPDIPSESLRFRIEVFDLHNNLIASTSSNENLIAYPHELFGIDTLSYENDSPFYVDPIEISGFTMPAVRFTAPDTLALLGARLYFHSKRGKGWKLRVCVFADSMGYPGELLGFVEIPASEIHTREEGTGWTNVDLTPLAIDIQKGTDFYITCQTVGVSMDSLKLIADNGNTDRSYIYCDGQWQKLLSVLGIGKNFFIQALVDYDHLSTAETENVGWGIRCLSNMGNLKLTIEDPAVLPATLRIYDIAGRLIKTKTLTSCCSNFGFCKLPSGVFLFYLESGGKTLKTGKFLIVH